MAISLSARPGPSRLNRINAISTKALADQAVKAKALQDQVNQLDARRMNLTIPVSPDLGHALEQIEQLGRPHE